MAGGERQLVQQLSAAYDSCLKAVSQHAASQADLPARSSSSLPDLPVQYTDFSHWQRQQMEGGAWENAICYWRENLAGIPEALDLPSDQIRPKMPSGEGYQLRMHIPRSLYKAIQKCAAEQEATVLMVLAATFQVKRRLIACTYASVMIWNLACPWLLGDQVMYSQAVGTDVQSDLWFCIILNPSVWI